MKPKEVFIELYYYPECSSSTQSDAFRSASIRWETDFTMSAPFNSSEAVRKHIYRERKRDKRPHNSQ